MSLKTTVNNKNQMIKKTYNSLGLDIPFEVPETVEEFDRNAKKEGACLAEAINNVIYRGSLAEFRDIFLHGREEVKNKETGEVTVTGIDGIDMITGIERKSVVVMKDGKPVVKDGEEVTKWDTDDSEATYFKRVCAELVAAGKAVDAEAAKKSFQSHAESVASQIAFDASATERQPRKPVQLAAVYKNSAAACFANKDVNWPKLESMLSKQGIPMPELTGDQAKDVLAVGWAIKSAKDAEAKKSLEQFTA